MQRVVLLLTTEHLDGALQLRLTAYQRVVLCHQVVEAHHLRAPSLVGPLGGLSLQRLVVTVLLLVVFHDIVVVATIFGDDIAEEALNVVVHGLGEQVGRLRVGQLEHGHHKVGHVELLGRRTDHVLVGQAEELVELRRWRHLILHLTGHLLLAVKVFPYLTLEGRGIAPAIGKSLAERHLGQQRHKHVLGHEELVTHMLGNIGELGDDSVHVIAMLKFLGHGSIG